MRKINSFLCIAVLCCAGCATSGTELVKEGEQLLSKSTNIVSSVDKFTYQPTSIGEPLKFEFGEQTSILLAGNERRFAKGFVLPANNNSYSVHITSFRQGTLDDPAIMYPEVSVLDKEYKIIKKLPANAFVFRTAESEAGLNAAFFVNNNSEGERYLLITNRPTAEADLVVSQLNITDNMVVAVPLYPAGFIMWYIPTGSNTPPIKMKALPTGSLELLIQSYSPRKVEND